MSKKNVIEIEKKIEIEMISIPHIIIQTGKEKSDINEHSLQWQKQNREFKYIFFDDKDCRKFIRAHFDKEVVSAFDTLKPGAFKADLFRYCYLYIKGGVYLDLDCSPIVPLSEILAQDIDFISVSERRNIPGVYQAFIACIPNCKFLLDAIQMIVKNCKNKYYPKLDKKNKWNSILSISGPVLLCNAMGGIHKSGIHSLDDKKIMLYSLKGKYIQNLSGKNIILSKFDGYDSGGSYKKMFLGKNVYKYFWEIMITKAKYLLYRRLYKKNNGKYFYFKKGNFKLSNKKLFILK